MFHIMLDAAGDVLRVHYKSMKCDVSISQGSVSNLRYLAEVYIPPSYNSAKIIKIDRDFQTKKQQEKNK